MKEIKKCPVCSGNQFVHFLKCKDHTVSGEIFSIVSCSSCSFKYTNPRPGDNNIGSYYKSEDYISHSNTSKGLISKLYHAVRSYTLNAKLRLVLKHVSRGTILDYGCGTGMFLNVAKQNKWEVYGLEPDEGARAIANSNGKVAFSTKMDLESGLNNKSVNAITLWHVLEHVTDLDETLQFFKKILAPKGVLIIAVPNYTSYDAKYYKEYWAAYDVPRHIYHFEVNTISKLLAGYDFELIETQPMKFDSFYVSMLSEKYKSGRINYLKAFITGLRSNMKANRPEEFSSVIYVFKRK